MLNQVVELKRDVSGVRIPGGEEISLTEGTRVYVTQMLGSTYTIAADSGLIRISRDNRDALGISEEDAPIEATSTLEDNASLEERIWETLHCIYDPEIPVDIVDLGLIYDIVITKLENDLHHVVVKMTLTAPGCGMGPHMMEEAKMRVESLEGVEEAEVEMIWDPPWNQSMVSEEGKMKLGLI
ncbi:MAG: putative Fe-S cluster assembly protein SufT [Akkermansia sp.]